MQRNLLWIFIFLISFAVAGGQAPEASATLPPTVQEPKPLIAIRALRAQIGAVETERSAKLKELDEATTVTEKEALAIDVQALNSKVASLGAELESVATGIDPSVLDDEMNSQVALDEALGQFLRPLVQEGVRATAKPRELEQLRNAIRYQTKRRDLADQAIGRLRELAEKTADATEKASLVEMQGQWETRREGFNNKLITAQYQLDQRLENDESLSDTLSRGVATFVRTRGKNILITLGAMAFALFLLRLLHRGIERFSPFRKRGHSFSARLFDVLFYALTAFITISTGLAALYSLGDWMLLGFALILLAGLIWASKTAVLQMGDQVKLMLNLGSVREGERLVFNGIPWKVKRIGPYTRLVNPSLEGGRMRLPLRDLIPLSSRPFGQKEPFFSTETDDWVELADGTYGKVVRQTPEWVQIVMLGGTIKTFSTPDFIGQNPANLSRGFRLNQLFGVDYAHQSIVTDEIPATLQAKLTNDLKALIGEENLANVRAEFASAGASSLDIALIADIKGAAADKYTMLTRAIQRSCVEACNEHGWIIPFTQITVHQAAEN